MAVMLGFFPTMSFALSGLKKALDEEKKLSRMDSLTGLANPRYFAELAAREIDRCRRYGHPLTLIYLDCDQFKEINDLFGHQAGDRVLSCLASAMRKNTRSTDMLARMGGDEFAILMPETGERAAPRAFRRLRGKLQEALQQGGWPITLCIGAAIFLDPPESVESMVKSADCLMFQAKKKGKNRIEYQVFDGEKYALISSLTDSSPSPPAFFPDEASLPAGLGGPLPDSPTKSAVSPPA